MIFENLKAPTVKNRVIYKYLIPLNFRAPFRENQKILKLIEKKLQKSKKNVEKKNENFENLGCVKIKGARNGSDARKLEGREK